MIFVDTSAWFALSVSRDQNHQAACDFRRQNEMPLVTTDYVLDETLTLMRARGENEKAITFGEHVLDESLCELEFLRPYDIRAAWVAFEHYGDKDWSFTDCTSLVVMERLGITTAFAFDRHFRQFPGVTVVPAVTA